METKTSKLKLLFDINENLSNISFLFKRIDVIADDIFPDLSRKLDLQSKKQAIMLEDALRVIQIKYDIMHECIQEISELLPDLLEKSNFVYSMEEEEINQIV